MDPLLRSTEVSTPYGNPGHLFSSSGSTEIAPDVYFWGGVIPLPVYMAEEQRPF